METLEYRGVETEGYVRERLGRLFANCKNGKRIIFPLLFIGVTILTIILAILLVIRTSGNSSLAGKNYTPKFCQTKACLKSGIHILSGMKVEVDPCESFNNFTCGRFLDDPDRFMSFSPVFTLVEKILTELKEHFFDVNNKDDEAPEAVKKASVFYQSCLLSELDYDQMRNRVNSEISRFKNRTSYTTTLQPKLINWIEMNIHGINEYLDVCVICVTIVQNGFDPSRKIIAVQHPPINSEYFRQQLSVFADYLGPLAKERIELFYDRMKRIQPKTFVEATTNKDNYMTIEHLSQEIPSIDWHYLIISTIEKDPSKPILGISENEVIFVNDLLYMKTLVKLIENDTFNLSVALTFFEWHVAMNIRSPFLRIDDLEYIEPFMTLNHGFMENLCISYVGYFFNYLANYMYDQTSFQERNLLQQNILQMIHHLKESFQLQSKTNNWLDEETKRFIDLKLESMGAILDFAPWSVDIDQVNHFYSQINLTGDFFTNIIILKTHFRRRFIDNFREPINEKERFYGRSPLFMAGLYYPSSNVLALPAILQMLPLYHKNLPGYMNFGSIGFILGHEMNHAFGFQGNARDEKGKVRFQSSVSKKFTEQFQSFLTHPRAYKSTSLYNEAKPEEILADIEGLRHAFGAYKQWQKNNEADLLLLGLEKYTPEQLFFISFGSNLCSLSLTLGFPFKNRVDLVVSNLEQFSEVFSCKKGSAMNPINKCQIVFRGTKILTICDLY